jgi:RNA polymerase sigma-70 factor, ECF subfamily
METVQTICVACEPEAAKQIPHSDARRLAAAVSKYSPALYRIAFRKLRNVEDAEDAVQDALLSAFKNMHQFRGDAQFSTWLGSIVLNSARMQLRRRPNHRFISLDENHEEGEPSWADTLEDGSPDAEEVLHKAQTRDSLERVVGKLPVCLRTAFRLRVFDGLTISEAAKALRVPEGTLKARFFRARVEVTALMRSALNSPSSAEN